ncbi:YCF48-related protein [Betaproteobacteria bacterium]|nr:YCF48-related protein [Betaproteobacteria bacterium]
MKRLLLINEIGRLIGFFFVFANICFADVINNDRLDVNKIFFTETEKVNDLIFAIGEAGIILSSRDGGVQWTQHKIDYKGLFTSFNFVNFETALFVGHDSTIFRTEDRGKSFQKILIETENPISFMKVKWLSTLDALIVGDFGSVFLSSDGGRSWKKDFVVNKDFDRHLYDILISEYGIFVVGESGTVLFRPANSNQWEQVDIPYSGSFFGGIIHDDSIYFFGMRGNILSTSLVSFHKHHASGKGKPILFNQHITPSKLGIMSASVGKDGSLFFYEAGGVVHEFSDGNFVRGEAALDTVVSTVEYGDSKIFAGLKGIKILK